MDIFKSLRICVWLSIALLPFVNSLNSTGGGGFSGSIIPLMIGCILYIVALSKKIFRKVVFPKIETILLLAWVIFAVVSTLININNVIYADNGRTIGEMLFLTKFVTYIFYLLIILFIYNVLMRVDTEKVQYYVNKMLMLSFCIAGIYSLLEILAIADLSFKPILIWIDSLFRGSVENTYFKVRSLTYEASTLGNYLSVVLPFIAVKIIEKNKIYYFWGVYLLLMAVMSLSRTVYIVVLLEMVMISVYLKTPRLLVNLFVVLGITSLVLESITEDSLLANIDIFDTLLSLDDTSDVSRMGSNLMRYGSQVAAYNIWQENFIWGIGLGQSNLQLIYYVPAWIWLSPDMMFFQYNMPVFGVYPRMLAEQGVMGIFCYLMLWLITIYKLHNVRKYLSEKERKFTIALIVSIIGNLVAQNNWDMLSYPAGWILLAIAWRTYSRKMT